MSSWTPRLTRSSDGSGGLSLTIGHELVDDYLRFVAARARANTLLAIGFDLKALFTVVGKEPAGVRTPDVLGFIEEQRRPRRGGNVMRIEDGEMGLSARTIKRRLASASGLFEYLIAPGACARNPVPRGLATRRAGRAGRGVPLIGTNMVPPTANSRGAIARRRPEPRPPRHGR